MGKEKPSQFQLGFLTPSEAEMVDLMRRFLADASRLYEVRTGKALTAALEIRTPRDAYEFLRLEMEPLDQEQLRTINLNTKNRIISSPLIYQATINATTIRIAEVFRPAIIDNATAIIVCHNHPSGSAEPSPEDVSVTAELVEAGKLLGVDVLDHLIIGKGSFVSLKDRGLGFSRKPS